MLIFPQCKINLGLYVTEKRLDGYHNIETVFYPVDWCDALEVIENTDSNAEAFTFHWHNPNQKILLEDQLIYKAWKLVNKLKPLPPISVHFYKNIPLGAGLGGGSSDAAKMIQVLNQKFKLNFSREEKHHLAIQLGSDCPFFIHDSAQYATGKGEILSSCSLNLSRYYLLLVYPNIHCNTALAYKNIKPKSGRPNLQKIVEQCDPILWKTELTNDFEITVFEEFPMIEAIKKNMYNMGAIYSSLSGSGSTVYGIFSTQPDMEPFKYYRTYLQEPDEKVS